MPKIAKSKGKTDVKNSIKLGQKNFDKILDLLQKNYPHAQCTLDFQNPLQLLIATILSAQCTDERVNKVTPALFQKYPSAHDYARAPLKELEKIIRSTGFYHNKARNIQNACILIEQKFSGHVPRTMEQLLTLPGVARKTANVVLFNAYGVLEGIAVDTHVTRLSHRLGLSQQMMAEKIEKDLMQLAHKKDWGMLSHYLIMHGRNICKAQKPLCKACFLQKKCPSAFNYDAEGKWIGVN